jgi:hypothetical protein
MTKRQVSSSVELQLLGKKMSTGGKLETVEYGTKHWCTVIRRESGQQHDTT